MGRLGAEDPSRAFQAAPPDTAARLQRLLAWMARQDFQLLVESGLLSQVEKIVVDSHRTLYANQRRAWSPPIAYRWLHYEDPMPVARLMDGTKRLRRRGAEFDAGAVEKVGAEASNKGFLN
jgi:hypothetical protein